MLHITERCINATAAWASIHRLNVPSLFLKVLLATLTVAAAVEAVVGAVAAGAATTNAEWTRSELEPVRSRGKDFQTSCSETKQAQSYLSLL